MISAGSAVYRKDDPEQKLRFVYEIVRSADGLLVWLNYDTQYLRIDEVVEIDTQPRKETNMRDFT